MMSFWSYWSDQNQGTASSKAGCPSIARSENVRIGGAAGGIDEYALVAVDAGFTRQSILGLHTDADDEEVRVMQAFLRFDDDTLAFRAQCDDRCAQHDLHTVARMHALQVARHFMPRHTSQHAGAGLEDRHLNPRLARRCRELQADESAADHGSTRLPVASSRRS
jgi:hypothetical protein